MDPDDERDARIFNEMVADADELEQERQLRELDARIDQYERNNG